MKNKFSLEKTKKNIDLYCNSANKNINKDTYLRDKIFKTKDFSSFKSIIFFNS